MLASAILWLDNKIWRHATKIFHKKLSVVPRLPFFEHSVHSQLFSLDAELKQTKRRVMNRIQHRNGFSQMKKSAVTRWRSLKSYFGQANGLRISKSKRKRNSGGTEMRAGPSQSDLRSSNEQLHQFKLTRRTAICSVREENDQRHGISLAELRRELIVRYLLIAVGMLWRSCRHLTNN